MMTSNPLPARESSMMMIRRRNKMKSRIVNDQIQNPNTSNQWKSEARQQLYSTKLLQALRHVRLNSHPSRGGGGGGGGKVVRETADRVLATTAKGRSRWSRAILTNRLKMKFMKKRRQRAKAATLSAINRPRKPRLSILKLKSKNLPAVQRKVRLLGRLVPGCRKEQLPVILEETIDYISALQMQIRAINNLLLASTSGAAAGPS
ncbi:transcription factor bHLH148-like [Impatiens glandulifera]|uniref:transcription factor bHLH148-like n=1 Tax=Impatiens glandulifera TaxID=253017 RepID=UPI001FB12E77|nr:transcription factor bHLH148-like [Impatiens glandulifera]